MKRSWNSRSISTIERLCCCACWVGWIGSVVVSAIGALPRNAFRPPHRQGTGAILRPDRRGARARSLSPGDFLATRSAPGGERRHLEPLLALDGDGDSGCAPCELVARDREHDRGECDQ